MLKFKLKQLIKYLILVPTFLLLLVPISFVYGLFHFLLVWDESKEYIINNKVSNLFNK